MKFDDVKEYLIAEADRMGLSEYEVYYMESSDISTETLKDEISSFSFGTRGGVCFRCIVDGHMGSASTELFTEEEMKELPARAVENAKSIEGDDKAILFEGSDKYAELTSENKKAPSSAELKEMALDIQRQTYEGCEYITDGTQAAVFTGETRTELMNSHGLRLSNTVSMSGAYVQAVVQKDGEAQEGFDWTLSLGKDELCALSKKATNKALSKIGAAEVDTGKYSIIISGEKMHDLLSAFTSSFSAKAAQLGMSRLRGKEGERVAADIITLTDDPLREGSPVQTTFDGEGVATYKKNVIENGVLKTLLYDLSTAYKAGRESTANGQRGSYSTSVGIAPYSFYINAGRKSLEDLLSDMQNGIYITEFKGMHAGCSAVTGDFSIESAGFIVRDGKLCEAVKSFTVAGNFFDLLLNIKDISSNVHFGIPSGFTTFGAPDVLLTDMSVAGK